MKKTYILGVIGVALTLSSCDNISLEERYIEVVQEKSEKVVLLEDFTGIRCVNCPDAAVIIDQLHTTYGENFIAVGLHPSSSEFSKPYRGFDLRSEVANAYFNEFKPQTFPTAMIDRTSVNGSVLLDNRTTWGSVVIEQLKLTTPVNIGMSSSYDPVSRDLTVNYSVSYTEDIPEETVFQLWLIENGIVGNQLLPEGWNTEYVHNHVLRDAINGTWGETLTIAAEAGDLVQKSNSIKLSDDWVAENCQVVGFVYRKSDKVILQAHLLSIYDDSDKNEDNNE